MSSQMPATQPARAGRGHEHAKRGGNGFATFEAMKEGEYMAEN